MSISIEDVPLNRFHRLLTVRSAGGSFVDGYVLSIIGVALSPLSVSLSLNEFWQGLIAASALIGIFFGGFLGGVISNHIGRRRLYFVGPTLFVFFSLLQYWVQSGEALFFYRLMLGIAVGIEYPVATAYLVEFLPKKYRGPRIAGVTIMWFCGAALAYVLGEAVFHLMGPSGWRLVMASAAIIGLALLLVRLGTPESPRWLISKGRMQEAEAVIKRVYGSQFSCANVPLEVKQKKLSFRDLISSGYGKRMAFITTFWTCSIIPSFAVFAFVPRVLEALHVKDQWASFGTVTIMLMFVIGCVVSTYIINRVGRRSLLIHSFLWSGLGLFFLGWEHDASALVIVFFFGIYALFSGGAQVLTLVYCNEIFPTEIRSGAVGFGTSVSRIGAAVGTWLVPISLSQLGIEITMYIAAAITLLGLLVSWLMAPETTQLNLNDAALLDDTPDQEKVTATQVINQRV